MAAVTKTAIATGSIATFWSPKAVDIKSLKIYFEPKQPGEGIPTPTSNVRPISGWSQLNLFSAKGDYKIKPAPGTTTSYGVTWVVDEDGLITATGSTTSYASCKAGIITVNGNETIYAKIEGTLNNVTFNAPTLYDSTGKRIVVTLSDGVLPNGLNLSQYEDVKQVTINPKRAANGVEMNGGSCFVIVTKDVKPTINSSLIDFSSFGTIYGGYVDLVTGEIWKTHHHYAFTGDETFYTSGSSWVTSFIPLVNGEKMRAYGPSWSGVCTHYPYGPYKQGSIGVMYGENTCTFDSRIRDAEGWKAFAKEQYNAGTPIEVVYLLRDPVLIGTLTPQQLSSLIGRNYYYSNADRVEVEYEYADSPELTTIKKRIVQNEPHLATVEGTVGHFYTDMAAPVKSLKVSFSPRQPGTGDASPTNVRPILGFDSVSVKRCGINLLQCDAFSDRNARGIKYEGTRNSEGEIESIHVYGTAEQNNCFANLNATANKIKLVSGSFGFYGYAEDGVNIYPITDKYGFAARDGKSISSAESSWRIIDIPSYKLDNSNQAWVRIQAIPDSTTSYVGTSIDTTVYPIICVEEDVGCDFEPYHGDTYTVSFSELGTIYGGYVDLVKGELTATHYHLDINTTSIPSMKIDGIYNNYIVIQFGVTANNLPQFVENTQISNRFSKSLPSGTPGRIATTPKYIYMVIPKDNLTGSDIAAIREWFANNPTEVVYELKTPITYQLTPQQIKTFRGTNNIYSFDGTVDVKYWLHSDVKTAP